MKSKPNSTSTGDVCSGTSAGAAGSCCWVCSQESKHRHQCTLRERGVVLMTAPPTSLHSDTSVVMHLRLLHILACALPQSTFVTMPDTSKNQDASPPPTCQPHLADPCMQVLLPYTLCPNIKVVTLGSFTHLCCAAAVAPIFEEAQKVSGTWLS